MGNQLAHFTEEQMDHYQDCSFFTRKEILRIFRRFRSLRADIVPEDMTQQQPQDILISFEDVEKMPELKENPFSRRICEVFAEDNKEGLTFDDFLDMFSIFGEAAPRELKAVYAFRIYDFDGDNHLGRADLEKTVNCITKSELSPEEIDVVCTKVLEEADLDDDGKLSFIEFEHVISRAPDFVNTFHIRI